jgi:hypothetical protein
MRAKGMVRAERVTFRCCDCGRPLAVNEALVCSHCDAQELVELRSLLGLGLEIDALAGPRVLAPPAEPVSWSNPCRCRSVRPGEHFPECSRASVHRDGHS